MRLLEKYRIVKVGIILIVLGVAWLYAVNYDLSKLALTSICSGLVFISECEDIDE